MDFKNLNKRKLEEEVEIDAEKLKKSELYKEKVCFFRTTCVFDLSHLLFY